MKKSISVLLSLIVFLMFITPVYAQESPSWLFDNINFSEAQKILGSGNPDILVAVIDTGIDCSHPALSGSVTAHIDAVDDITVPHTDNCEWNTSKLNSHGTHVAGIIGGKTTGGMQIGIAPGVKFLDIRALDRNGAETKVSIEKGITAAIENHADIINMSLCSEEYDKNIDAAIRRAIANGIIVVAASGNDKKSSFLQPADIPNVICVNATDDSDALAPFSNYGWVSKICAPGVSIFSSVVNEESAEYINGDASLGDYACFSGTSMASPVVCGSIALIKSKYPDLRLLDIQNILYSSARKPQGYTFEKYGFGILDLHAAAKEAQKMHGTDKTQIKLSGGGTIYRVYNGIADFYALSEEELRKQVSGQIYFDFSLSSDLMKPQNLGFLDLNMIVLDSAGFIVNSNTINLNLAGDTGASFSPVMPLNLLPQTSYYYDYDAASQKGRIALLYDYSTFRNYFENGKYFLRLQVGNSYAEVPFEVKDLIENVNLKTSDSSDIKVNLSFDLKTDLLDIPGDVFNEFVILACDKDDPLNLRYPVYSKNITNSILKSGKCSFDFSVPDNYLSNFTSGKIVFVLARGNTKMNTFPVYDFDLASIDIQTGEQISSDSLVYSNQEAVYDNLPAENNNEIWLSVVILVIAASGIALGILIGTLITKKRKQI